MWATSGSSTGSSTSGTKSRPLVWKFDAKAQGGGRSPHSVALLGNNMYFTTNNDTPTPRLVALDKNSGQVVFDVNTTDSDSRAQPGTFRRRRSRSRT